MKILFVLENYYPNIGGVETLFKNLSESLVQRGYTITILTNQFSKSLSRRESINGVDIVRVPFYNRYLFTILAFFPAFKLARQHDIIHTTSYNAGVPAFFAGLLSRKKVLITFHEVWGKLWFDLPYMSKFSLSLHYLFEKFLLLLPFYRFIAVSEATQKNLIGAGIIADKTKLIHNGIEYDKFALSANKGNEATSDHYKFIYFGRLGISKGINLILDAVELLKEGRQKFRLTLVIPSEPADFRQKIIHIIKTKKIESLIDIKSDLEAKVLQTEITNSDAVIIPSYSEGFCFTAVESMALGIPIISSGKGALEEVVNGKHLTMKSHDGEGLAEAMEMAMANEWDEKESVKFELEDSIQKYMALYNSLII